MRGPALRSARPATASASARRSSRRSDAERSTVERPTLEELRADDDIDGQDAPRRAVELDRHASAAVLAQRGDGRHYLVFAAAFPTVSGSACILPFVSERSAAGSKRADATCSGPSSVWIFARIA